MRKTKPKKNIKNKKKLTAHLPSNQTHNQFFRKFLVILVGSPRPGWSWTMVLNDVPPRLSSLGKFLQHLTSRNWELPLPSCFNKYHREPDFLFPWCYAFLGGNPGKPCFFLLELRKSSASRIMVQQKLLTLKTAKLHPSLFPKRSEVRSLQSYQASKFFRFRVWILLP